MLRIWNAKLYEHFASTKIYKELEVSNGEDILYLQSVSFDLKHLGLENSAIARTLGEIRLNEFERISNTYYVSHTLEKHLLQQICTIPLPQGFWRTFMLWQVSEALSRKLSEYFVFVSAFVFWINWKHLLLWPKKSNETRKKSYWWFY